MIQTRTILIPLPYVGISVPRSNAEVQACAACAALKHLLALLQLEGINLFHCPSQILWYAPGRFWHTSVQAENLDPDLQSHSTEQAVAIPIRDNMCLFTCQAAALLGIV